MSNIIISTDSPADLDEAFVQAEKISVAPLHVIIAGESRDDGVDVKSADIFRLARDSGALPGTSAVSVAEYSDLFAALTADGSQVVHISLSGAISSTYQNAVIAAGDCPGVSVIDSLNLHSGLAMLVYIACDLRAMGFSAQEIAERVSSARSSVRTSFLLENLEYMKKGGRCSSVAALGANILGIKPSLKLDRDGSIKQDKKYRGKSFSARESFIKDFFESEPSADTKRCFLTYSTAPDADELEEHKKTIRRVSGIKDVICSPAGCVICSHCGPGTLGLTLLRG